MNNSSNNKKKIISKEKKFLSFLLKNSIIFGILATGFSSIGIFLPNAHSLDNPLDSASVEHILGHIAWGLFVGIVSFNLRYFFLTGIFASILDFDHFVHFLGIDATVRMAHSIPFGILSATVLTFLCRKKNYWLAVVSFASIFSHISFDILYKNEGPFPLFTPFYNEYFYFRNIDWILFEFLAIAIIGIMMIQTKQYRFLKRVKNYSEFDNED